MFLEVTLKDNDGTVIHMTRIMPGQKYDHRFNYEESPIADGQRVTALGGYLVEERLSPIPSQKPPVEAVPHRKILCAGCRLLSPPFGQLRIRGVFVDLCEGCAWRNSRSPFVEKELEELSITQLEELAKTQP